jgi:carbon monoxide dehydrogenase subunit G
VRAENLSGVPPVVPFTAPRDHTWQAVVNLCGPVAALAKGARSLKISGRYSFPATREEVWAALNDPEVLARTIPGCQRLEQVGENAFESTLKIGLQAVRGTYTGMVRLEDIRAPEHYKIVVDGKGSNGFMQGEGSIDLHEEGESTSMDYAGEAQVGGTIASVGQRLIEGAAKTLINQSLKALAAQIEARKQGPAAGSQQEQGAPAAAGEPAVGEAVTAAASEANAPQPDTRAEVALQDAPQQGDAVSAGPQPEFATRQAEPSSLQASGFERRSVVVPKHEQLSEADVARGVIADFLNERPWLPWVVIAFLVGIVLGQRKR